MLPFAGVVVFATLPKRTITALQSYARPLRR